MSILLLWLLAAGIVTSAAALILDARTSSPRAAGSRSGRQSTTQNRITDAVTILAALSVVAALAVSALDPQPAQHDGAPHLARVAATALALLLAIIGGGPFAVLALRLATRGQIHEGINGGILVNGTGTEQSATPTPPVAPRRGLFSRRSRDTPQSASIQPAPQAMGTSSVEVLRGGTTIGFLERVAIAGAILAGFPEAIAVVIAIKGVGRFSELAAAEAKERFIIGTLASFVWACACALVLR